MCLLNVLWNINHVSSYLNLNCVCQGYLRDLANHLLYFKSFRYLYRDFVHKIPGHFIYPNNLPDWHKQRENHQLGIYANSTGHFTPTNCLNDKHSAKSLSTSHKLPEWQAFCQQLVNLPQTAWVTSILSTACQPPTICPKDEHSANSLSISHNLPKRWAFCQQLINLPTTAWMTSILATACQPPTICQKVEHSANSLSISHNLPE